MRAQLKENKASFLKFSNQIKIKKLFLWLNKAMIKLET